MSDFAVMTQPTGDECDQCHRAIDAGAEVVIRCATCVPAHTLSLHALCVSDAAVQLFGGLELFRAQWIANTAWQN